MGDHSECANVLEGESDSGNVGQEWGKCGEY